MSYADRSALIDNRLFMGRLDACVANEAIAKPTAPFTDEILRSWGYGSQVFGPLVISQPGFEVEESLITDGMLLSAVQTVWDRAESLSEVP